MSVACKLQVIAPYDAEDSRGLMKAAIRDPDPVVFLENEILYGETFQVHTFATQQRFKLSFECAGAVEVKHVTCSAGR